jgi:hypothetical protein
MLLVADECVDFSIIECLRKRGIEVFAIVEQDPSIIDEDVLDIAVRMGAPLITEDKDFGELVFRLKLPHHGPYDPNPANGHAGVLPAPSYDADGFWQYANGPVATDSTWRLPNYRHISTQ